MTDDRLLDEHTLELLRGLKQKLGHELTLMEGSPTGNIAASRGTHKTRDMGVWDE